MPLFRKPADYETFERIIIEAQERHPTRLLAWCLMRNYWHFVVWPRAAGELTTFFRWLALTHAVRQHAAHKTAGSGRLYQGRFRCFPVQKDEHLLTICRFVERIALMAGVVKRAEEWPWSSLGARLHGSKELRAILCDWPIARPRTWVKLVNKPLPKQELEKIRVCIARNRPFGSTAWQLALAKRLGLMHTLRPLGRPTADHSFSINEK